MTVKELKEFIADCDDNDRLIMCQCQEDNPISDSFEIGTMYKIKVNNDATTIVCLMPMWGGIKDDS